MSRARSASSTSPSMSLSPIVMAKSLTAAFINNIESIYHAKAPFMPGTWHGETDPALTDVCGNNPIKYHPGAVAAWEEAGYTIPDCAK